jgi:acyl-coenzyme A thioesterase PaaI-like protein
MDVTAFARSLLEPIPAHRTAGIQVQRAIDGTSEVVLVTPLAMTNVIGSLHSSGLVALVDAAGLAAIIAACDTEDDFHGVVPLGAAASVDFRAPARGRLVASCQPGQEARLALRPVLTGEVDRARITTVADVVDEAGVLVCRGHVPVEYPPSIRLGMSPVRDPWLTEDETGSGCRAVPAATIASSLPEK